MRRNHCSPNRSLTYGVLAHSNAGGRTLTKLGFAPAEKMILAWVLQSSAKKMLLWCRCGGSSITLAYATGTFFWPMTAEPMPEAEDQSQNDSRLGSAVIGQKNVAVV